MALEALVALEWRWVALGGCVDSRSPQNPRNRRVKNFHPAPVPGRPAQSRFNDGGQPERALVIRGERGV